MTQLAGALKSRCRYLDPETLLRLGNLNVAARSVVEGFLSGLLGGPGFH